MPTTPSITRSVAAGTLCTTRPPARERRQRRLVGAFRVEQHRGGGDAAAAQERRGPQRVAAVVAGADDGADPPPGDAAGEQDQFAGDRGGQPVGGPPHQRAVGQRLPAAALRLRGSHQRCSSAASAPVPLDLPARQYVTWCRGPTSDIRAGRYDGESSRSCHVYHSPVVSDKGHELTAQRFCGRHMNSVERGQSSRELRRSITDFCGHFELGVITPKLTHEVWICAHAITITYRLNQSDGTRDQVSGCMFSKIRAQRPNVGAFEHVGNDRRRIEVDHRRVSPPASRRASITSLSSRSHSLSL